MPTEQTQIIKRSIQYRVKYRVDGGKKKHGPGLVVPHPNNRGKDPMAPTRLRELGGTLALEGYDVIEANTNGVAVQQKPASSGGAGKGYQEAFSLSLKVDHDIAEFGPGGTNAILGSLSHSHLNCVARNVLAGLRGCECMEPTVVGKRKALKCTCKARPILDENGNYCMDLLQGHDRDWWLDIQTGLEWEELHWKMDEEEPDVALVIAVSLNKKNAVAMETGHCEIFTAMANLLNPDPMNGNIVEFEPVRDQLIDLYGSSVNNLDLVFVFRFAMAAGGKGSIWLQRLSNFTTIFVNQKKRKMQMAVYAQIAPYPVAVPGIKNACLKWSWHQPPRLGWCVIPPDISHRFNDESKYEWCDIMTALEEVFGAIYDVASAVIEKSAVAECDKVKKTTCWVSTVEVDVMTLLFTFGKLSDEKAHEKQKVVVADKIAGKVAMQMLELVKVGAPAVTRQNIPSLQGGEENKLLQGIMELVRNDAWPSVEPAVAGARVVLAPTVTVFDAAGKATTELATVQQKKIERVDVLPWAKWVELETPCDNGKLAKLLLETAIRQIHRPFMADLPPIAMMRIGRRIEMRTKEPIPKGQCVIPIFSGGQTPWLWMATKVECDLAMASTARFIGRGGR